MPLYFNYHQASQSTQRVLDGVSRQLSSSMEKLSSGYRINRASDDAAGLQISERLRAVLRGNESAQENVQDGANVLAIMDGAMGQITDNLQRMRELAVNAANDTLSSSDRTATLNEMLQLQSDITRMTTATTFNGMTLLNGSLTDFDIQVGEGATTSANVLNLATVSGVNPFGNLNATTLGVASANITVGSNASATATIALLDTAITTVSSRRSIVGALSSRLSGALNHLQVAYENVGASEARIRNVDVSRESTRLAQWQVMQSAAISILTQTNSSQSNLLSLLSRS
jgi:flagellin